MSRESHREQATRNLDRAERELAATFRDMGKVRLNLALAQTHAMLALLEKGEQAKPEDRPPVWQVVTRSGGSRTVVADTCEQTRDGKYTYLLLGDKAVFLVALDELVYLALVGA